MCTWVGVRDAHSPWTPRASAPAAALLRCHRWGTRAHCKALTPKASCNVHVGGHQKCALTLDSGCISPCCCSAALPLMGYDCKLVKLLLTPRLT
eukprot:scaffold271393_cov22-Tisochrysis_lutea.AAC.1